MIDELADALQAAVRDMERTMYECHHRPGDLIGEWRETARKEGCWDDWLATLNVARGVLKRFGRDVPGPEPTVPEQTVRRRRTYRTRQFPVKNVKSTSSQRK